MKAIVQEGRGSADVLHVMDVPRPELLDGRVLVRIHAASVNALDWHTVHGGRLMDIVGSVMRMKQAPVRGVDLAGTVEAVGKDVTRFKPGDEVFGSAPGTFAEFASAREDRLALKPASLTFEEAASMGVAGYTALQGLRDIAGLKPGQRVLVYGAGGGVGTFAVQIAKALGAHVTAVTGPRNVELVRGLGPDAVLEHGRDDVARRPERYDVVFDVAAVRSLSHLRRVLAPGGILVLVGADKRGGAAIFTRIISALVRSRVLKQRVKFFVAKNDLSDLLVLRGLVEEGKLRPAIDRTFPFDRAAEAVRYVGTGQARAKVVITM
ncbi:MAG: NAD(P)-dependent alcohol dehydrogenase [Chloroflexi bacterium]|nr:NAD(P)-dependent alcohol dehydrogenase [Chloroflexota bacterium]